MISELTKPLNPEFSNVTRNYWLLGLFAIAMGALEAIVVVYLRQVYYPLGFDFPLTMLTSKMTIIEWIREIATIVMLITIALIAGKTFLQRFSWFLYAFAIWDIFYYIWLKLLLNWPSSLFTWDILFLVPVPWVGPVLAPVICSFTMILLAVLIIYRQGRYISFRLKKLEWSFLIIGALLMLVTFMWDYTSIIINDGLLSKFWILTNDTLLLKNVLMFVPSNYNWVAFIIGEIFILASLVLIYRREEYD